MEELEQVDIATINNKKDSINTFLSGIWNDDTMSENDPVDPMVRRISGFQTRKDLYLEYCEILCDVGEESKIPTIEYFLRIWNQLFPHLGNFSRLSVTLVLLNFMNYFYNFYFFL